MGAPGSPRRPQELEAIGNAFIVNAVPGSWAAVGFLSLKPLTAWTVELQARVAFLDAWAQKGAEEAEKPKKRRGGQKEARKQREDSGECAATARKT